MVNSETKADVEEKDIYSITRAHGAYKNIYVHLSATASAALLLWETLVNSAALAVFLTRTKYIFNLYYIFDISRKIDKFGCCKICFI